jgi:hypothetical protein
MQADGDFQKDVLAALDWQGGGRRRSSNCRWATATVFLPPPFWFEAESCPWTCLRGPAPHVLSTTDLCATCLRWEPRASALLSETPDHKPVTGTDDTAASLMVDLLGGLRPPDEMR